MPDFISIFGELAKFLGGGATGIAAMRFLFKIEKDLQPCQTRFKYKTPGWPWHGQLAVHRNEHGWDMQLVKPTLPKAPTGGPDVLTKDGG